MKKITITSLVFSLLIFISSPLICRAADIRLSAAASMNEAVRALVSAYAREHPEITILSNFASSGALARQIVQGAPADLFISANARWMDYLVRENKIDRQTVRFFAANSLVYSGLPGENIDSLEDIAAFTRIAIGSPGSVPAGQYAEQAMRAAGIYEKLRTGKKLVMAKDVRQALLYADRGEVDGAFVYRTDALLAGQAVILFTVPEELHDRIEYPAGLTVEGVKKETVRAFYDFMTGPEAPAVLEQYGFSAPSSPAAGTD